MRIPVWLTVILGVLGVGFVGGYYLALWQQKQYQVLLVGAVALAFLAWLGSGAGLLGLLREIYKDRKDEEEKRKRKLRKHTKNLNEQVYKKLLHILIRSDSRGKRKQCMIPYSEEEYRKYMGQLMITPFWEHDQVPDPPLRSYDKLQFLERGMGI